MGSGSSIHTEQNSKGAYLWKTTSEEISRDCGKTVKGKTVVITGCNGGIGFEVARNLAIAGAEVIFACRSKEKAEIAINNILKEEPKAKMAFMEIDLSCSQSVRVFVDNYRKSGRLLHILINNAVAEIEDRTLINVNNTEDNYPVILDYQFAVNYLGHYLLTMELLDIMKASCHATMLGRIINVSSFTNYFLLPDEGIEFSQFINRNEMQYDKYEKHAASKLALIIFTRELANRLRAKEYPIQVVSLHPGIISNTNSSLTQRIKRKSLTSSATIATMNQKGLWKKIMQQPRKTIPQGAATTLFCAMASDQSIQSGNHYADCNITSQYIHKLANDETQWKSLWKLSRQITQNSSL